ncbi:PIN-like domain-containing protein [Kineococcus terrestris]|uniref:PIN-like domain-containing protein n=1 Tax=Kineococcus terrestris TaxID=2044856 RepID=UPI0034DB3C6C
MNGEVGTGRNLFDGFEEYRSPTQEEYRSALLGGVIVPDTNVLRNLYRYNARTRQDLFAALGKLEDRLWVPHQVVLEFMEGLDSARRDIEEDGQKVLKDLRSQRYEAGKALREWANRVDLPKMKLETFDKRITEGFNRVIEDIETFASEERRGVQGSSSDQVLDALEKLVRGRVGGPLPPDEHSAAVEEGMRRVVEKIPPGYKDNRKSGHRAAGDYLVWKQAIMEASRRQCPLVLITADQKEDWWHEERGQKRGPRRELIRELRGTAGVQLFLKSPKAFLEDAKNYLAVEISTQSVEDVQRVDVSVALEFLRADEATRTGGRYGLEKMPEGSGGDYAERVSEMTQLVSSATSYEDFLDAFQQRFPSITRRDEARRRSRGILESLGFVSIAGDSIVLTDAGRQYLDEPSLGQLQECLLRRIRGAVEIKEMVSALDVGESQEAVIERPPAGISSTQALRILKWLDQLQLLK